ncbi:MAG: hypothetical protein IAE85_19435 [Anaerolinea sp.]|nr:hypothetical protein [Anaerolinea sp.]
MTTPTTPPAVPPQARFFQWVQGWVSLLLCHSLVKTGVFEQMAAGPRTADEIAGTCGLHRDTLFRTLRMMTALEITAREGDRYSLTGLGRTMLKDTPGSLYTNLVMIGSDAYQRPWQNFAYTLATGESAFTHVMGAPFFDYLEQHPELGIPFQQTQAAYALMTDPPLAAAYDFSPFRTVCDVGGGQGAFLKRILEAHPHLRGILLDMPGVTANHVLGGLGDRVAVIAGSFFERVPPADLLILKAVLHDWSDEKCAVILARCREAMPPDGRLLIIDRLLEEPFDAMSLFYDLHMLQQIGGRERTAEEMRSLLADAGLQMRRVIVPTESPVFPLRLVEAAL